MTDRQKYRKARSNVRNLYDGQKPNAADRSVRKNLQKRGQLAKTGGAGGKSVE